MSRTFAPMKGAGPARWRRRWAALAGVLALGLLLAPMARVASFQVSPTRFEFSLERRFTDFFTVTNNSAEPLRLRVVTAFLEPDERGTLQAREKHPHDLAPWLVLNPRRITLDPAEKRVVRFSIRPPADLPPGEYRTVVFFEELPARPDGREDTGTGFRIQILTRLGVTIYGRVGDARPEVRLEAPSVAVEAEALRVKALLHNAGTAHAGLDLVATLLGADDAEVGQQSTRATLQRGQRLRADLALPRPSPGTYRLRLQGRIGGQLLWQDEQSVTVEAGNR